MKYFYERSSLVDSDVNIHFEDLLYMDSEQTTEWIEKMRLFILHQWDNYGVPPTIGQDENTIKKNFRKLRDYSIQKFLMNEKLNNPKPNRGFPFSQILLHKY